MLLNNKVTLSGRFQKPAALFFLPNYSEKYLQLRNITIPKLLKYGKEQWNKTSFQVI